MHHIFIFATMVTEDYLNIHDANDYLLHNSYKHAKMTRFFYIDIILILL